MSMPNDLPYPSGPAGAPPGPAIADRPSAGGAVLAAAGIIVASALIGLAAGQIWSVLAPRAVYVVVTHGSADVINPETTAFIAADAVYCMIGAVGGLIIGLAGYLLAVRKHGPVPMAAILAGSIVAGVVARWIGEHSGLTAFNHQLLTSPIGTHLSAPLVLAGDTSAAAWPTVSSFPALAFWPLAACIVAGGLTLLVVWRARQAAAAYPSPYPGPQQPYGSLPG
jgi:hypothetical protein